MKNLNLDVVKADLSKKSTDQLITILSFNQDEYVADALPLIDEILIERGTPLSDIDQYKRSYNSLVSKLASAPKLFRPASFAIRLCQYIIDHVLFFGICYLIQYYLNSKGLLDNSGRYEAYCLLAFLLYYTFTIEFFKATIGMLIMGLKLVTKEKQTLTFGYGISRATGMIANFFTLQLGHLLMLFRKDKRTLVDIWSKTMVVYNK